jgi:hypothetical protein
MPEIKVYDGEVFLAHLPSPSLKLLITCGLKLVYAQIISGI